MLAAMIAMLGVALAVPGAFGEDAALFGVAYLVVRILHVLLSFFASRDDPASRSAIVRAAPTGLLAALLVLLAAFLDGSPQVALWIVALSIGYLGPAIIGWVEGGASRRSTSPSGTG